MAEHPNGEIFDAFADQLVLTVGPFGCTITYSLSAPPLPGQTQPLQPLPVATIRVSLEHLKAMAFVVHKGVKDYEKEHVPIGLSDKTLELLHVSRADWDAFWG